MERITLFLYPDGNHFMARTEPDGHAGDAWPLQRHALNGMELLDAVVHMYGAESFETYRFSHDGTNWFSTGAPIAQVNAMDLLPIGPSSTLAAPFLQLQAWPSRVPEASIL